MALQHSDRGKGIPKLLPLSTLNPTLHHHHHRSIHPPGASWQAVVQHFTSLSLLVFFFFFFWFDCITSSLYSEVLSGVIQTEGQSVCVVDEQIIAKRHGAEKLRQRGS